VTGEGPATVAVPAAARIAFGPELALAERYAGWLSGPGVERGLLGPREPSRVWDRHLLNSAVLADYLPNSARVVDVGSGAGLPGLVLAIRRPDLSVDLVEPLLRRVDFLTEVVADLALSDRVRVIRGRAEDPAVRAQLETVHWVVARAVAPLDRLVRWCLPLLSPAGQLLALKGSGAVGEVSEHRKAMRRLGAGDIRVERPTAEWLETPTWVVSVQKGTA
jgi:16S rRNA (guanine527-N7)-methyltransferase